MADSDLDLDLAQGARTSLRANATAYAYSIFITSCFGIVSVVIGNPDVLRIFLFLSGATLAFALSEAAVSRGFKDRIRPDPSDVVMLGSAMAVISVSVAVAVAWLASELVRSDAGWFLAPFAGTVAYVALSSVEMAVARRKHEEDPPDREK